MACVAAAADRVGIDISPQRALVCRRTGADGKAGDYAQMAAPLSQLDLKDGNVQQKLSEVSLYCG